MGKVGFGGYRVSIKSIEHRQALILALKDGCSLIDTSSNYTNGESEELIGSVLSENPIFKPLIVTKAGYIQGRNLDIIQELNANGLAIEDLVDLGENLKHSIHPDFLKNQLDGSLKRLKRSSVDIFLLHNPEYYFKTEGATQVEYYRRIQKAFAYLETEVESGRIKSYGISSNNFILPPTDPEVTDLKKVLEAAKKNSPKNHFTTIQFPFNLIEIGALEKFGEYGDESLLELAQLNNLTTMINRPLNAFTNNKLVRLATYEFFTKDFDEKDAQSEFESAMALLEKKWKESSSSDHMAEDENFNQIPLIKQFTELWKTLPTADAVEQVYYGHFFPFIARLWESGGLSASESEPFYKLLENSLMYSRINMSLKAHEFQKQAASVGLIPSESERPFAVDVLETYLNYGFDYVLLGMKKPEYVNQVKHLF
ncbi:MAG: aldo/keto reductase [Bacteriovorax sp.]|jgi:aryl-alcohol dehydrogenase-like predicted oxidoreductase